MTDIVEIVDRTKPLPVGTLVRVSRKMAIIDNILPYTNDTYGYYKTGRSGNYRKSINKHALWIPTILGE